MKTVEMGSPMNRTCWFNTKYLLVGIIFGVCVTYVSLRNMPENFGLMSLQEYELVRDKLQTVANDKNQCNEKLKQETATIETIQRKGKELEEKINSCESSKTSIQQQYDKLKVTSDNLQQQKYELDSEKSELTNKDTANQKTIATLTAEIDNLKTSLAAEQEKNAKMATELESLKAASQKQVVDKVPKVQESAPKQN